MRASIEKFSSYTVYIVNSTLDKITARAEYRQILSNTVYIVNSTLDKITARAESNIRKRFGSKFESSIIFLRNTNLKYSQNYPFCG